MSWFSSSGVVSPSLPGGPIFPDSTHDSSVPSDEIRATTVSQTTNACVRCRIPRPARACVARFRGAISTRSCHDTTLKDARVSGAFGCGDGLRRASRTPLGEQLEGALERQALDVLAPAQARVRLPVGDVRPEAAVLDHERLAARGVGPSSLSGGFGAPRPRRCFGCARTASASDAVMPRSCSSDSSERVSEPRLT